MLKGNRGGVKYGNKKELKGDEEKAIGRRLMATRRSLMPAEMQ